MRYTCKKLKQISRGALSQNWGIVICAYALISIITSLVTSPFQKPINDLSMQNMYQSFESMGMGEMFIEMYGTVTIPSTTELILAISATLIISLVATVLTAGHYRIHLSVLRKEKNGIKALFSQFKNRPDRYILSTILLTLILVACMLPMMIAAALITYFAWAEQTIGVYISLIATLVTFVAGLVFTLLFSFKYSQITYLYIDNPEMGVWEGFKESSRIMKGNIGRYLYMVLSFLPLHLLNMLTFGIGSFFLVPYMTSVQSAFYMDVSGDFQRREEEARRLEEEMGPVLSE